MRRTQAATARPGKRKRAGRHIGCPWEFYAAVCQLTRGRAALTVALYVYRQTQVRRRQTVTVDGAELAELGVDRKRSHEAIHNLEDAGVVRLDRVGLGRKTEVTLLWCPASP